MKKLRTVIVGCGNIASAYAKQLQTYSNIQLLGFCDLMPERAKEFSETYGGKAYPSLDAVLEDSEVELIVNLTIHHAHAEVISRALTAGKHVHSEKPLATSFEEAKKLVELAERCQKRLSSAPSTFLGEPVQTLARELRGGRIGSPRLLYGEINHGRIESWHPNPAPFYGVGPVWDVAVYPLGVWMALFGPVRRVSALGRILMKDHVDKEGKAFTISKPDYYTATIDFANGVTARLTANFYVSPSKQGSNMEFHGDKGALFLGSSYLFDAKVEAAVTGGDFAEVALVRPGSSGVEFARGVEDLAEAILNNRPHRCSARMALHVVEVMDAIHDSAKTGKSLEITSDFELPPPMPWAQ